MAISAVIVAVSAAAFAAAVLVWRTDLLPPVKFAASVGSLILAMWLRPKFTRRRIGEATELPEGGAPALRDLVGQVSTAAAAPLPDVILLDPAMVNCSVTRVGVRGRVVLTIGIPLWLMLTPAMRISVLAHEFGHVANRDPTRRVLAQPALHLFRSAVEWTGGSGQLRRLAADAEDGPQLPWMVLVLRLLLALVNNALAAVQLAIDTIAMPDHRRAEYAADLTSRSVAGTAAATATMNRLAGLSELAGALAYDVERLAPLHWEQSLSVHSKRIEADLPVLRQATRRTADVWSVHPPAGCRVELLDRLATLPPEVAVDPILFARIDAELANFYARTHSVFLGTREFAG